MSMSEDEIRKLARDALAEQGTEAIERMGAMAATMYQAISRGAPPRLAATLTRDWFYLQVHKALWPNSSPQAPLWDMSTGEGE